MARMNRIKADGLAYYHVISRVANKAFLLKGSEIKRTMVNMLYRAAEFSGVDIVTYAVMDNHFHLCIRVPEKAEIPESEVVRRVGVLYGEEEKGVFSRRLARLREDGEGSSADAEIDRFRARMGDLSEFMKTFKQRVTQWFNANHRHEGTLWSGRFKSVLVEDGMYLRNMVDYIHGNPVRAGIVSIPEDYEWCAPGAAARGDIRAKKGLSLVGRGGCGFGARDGRLVNGVIVGSRGYVKRMALDFAGCFKCNAVDVRFAVWGAFRMYMTHGQRSA